MLLDLLKADNDAAGAAADSSLTSSGKAATAIKVGKGKGQKVIVPEVPLESVAESGRLFVRNIPFMCTEDDLAEAFKKFGPLSEVHMPIDKATKQGKGFAYILYLIPEHAVLALSAMDGSIFQVLMRSRKQLLTF